MAEKQGALRNKKFFKIFYIVWEAWRSHLWTSACMTCVQYTMQHLASTIIIITSVLITVTTV